MSTTTPTTTTEVRREEAGKGKSRKEETGAGRAGPEEEEEGVAREGCPGRYSVEGWGAGWAAEEPTAEKEAWAGTTAGSSSLPPSPEGYRLEAGWAEASGAEERTRPGREEEEEEGGEEEASGEGRKRKRRPWRDAA